MPKIKISTIINDNKNEYDAIITNDIIKYIDDNGTVSIKIKKDEIILNRDNMELVFREKELTQGILKNNSYIFKLNIYTNKLIIEKNYIEIDYSLEEQNINFKLLIK